MNPFFLKVQFNPQTGWLAVYC